MDSDCEAFEIHVERDEKRKTNRIKRLQDNLQADKRWDVQKQVTHEIVHGTARAD